MKHADAGLVRERAVSLAFNLMHKLLKCCRAEVLVRRFVRSGKYRARCAKCLTEKTKPTKEKLAAEWNRAVTRHREERRNEIQDTHPE